MRALGWCLLATACALSAALRLPFLSVPLIDDEAGYAYVSSWLARGLTLYRDLWFDRPQGIFLIYGAILWLFGDSTEGIRLAAGLYNTATICFVYFLGARLLNRRAALAAAFVYAVASASPAIEGFTANGELFMNLPVVVAVLCAARGRMFAAGCLVAVATLVKPTALLGAAPAVAAIGWSAHPSLRSRVRPVAMTAAGAVLVAVPFVVHGVLSGPDDFWYAVVGFRTEEHSAFSAGARFFDELRQTAPHVAWALLPLWLLIALWLWRGHWRTPSGRVLLTFLAGTTAGAAIGGYWYWHYFTGLLPPAALIAGDSLSRDALPRLAAAMRRLASATRRLHLPTAAPGALGAPFHVHSIPRRRAVWWVLAAVIAVSISLAANASLVGATPDETSWRIYRRDTYLASRDVARYLRERTGADDTVYAAFAGAEVYFMSQRRAAGRHLYWTEINRVPGALDAVVRTLDDPRHCPKYIIRLQSELERPGRAAAFWDRVEHHFFPEAIIRGVILYRRLDD